MFKPSSFFAKFKRPGIAAMLCGIVVFATFLFFFRSNIGILTLVEGNSMNPTLNDNQFVFGTSTTIADVERNDIILFERYDGVFLIKRVVAVPGDTLEIKDNKLIVNGNVIAEDYIKEPMNTADLAEFKIPQGRYFVLGDNRNNSEDSRALGLIGENNIEYVVVATERMTVIIITFTFLAIYILLCILYMRKFVNPVSNQPEEN